MKNKEDMLLTLLLSELVGDTGNSFLNKETGAVENFEVVRNFIISNEKEKDKFYTVILEQLEKTIKKIGE